MPAYNLFHRKGGPDVFCAPEDCVVPGFLAAPFWEFTGKIDGASPPPPGFDERAAPTAVRFNGCYFFVPLGGEV